MAQSTPDDHLSREGRCSGTAGAVSRHKTSRREALLERRPGRDRDAGRTRSIPPTTPAPRRGARCGQVPRREPECTPLCDPLLAGPSTRAGPSVGRSPHAVDLDEGERESEGEHPPGRKRGGHPSRGPCLRGHDRRRAESTARRCAPTGIATEDPSETVGVQSERERRGNTDDNGSASFRARECPAPTRLRIRLESAPTRACAPQCFVSIEDEDHRWVSACPHRPPQGKEWLWA